MGETWDISSPVPPLFPPSDLLQGLPLPELCWKPEGREPVSGPWSSVSWGANRVVTEQNEDIRRDELRTVVAQ